MTKVISELQRSCSKIHIKSFTHEDYTNDAEMSEEYWKAKGKALFQK